MLKSQYMWKMDAMFRKFLIFILFIFSPIACTPATSVTTSTALTTTYQPTNTFVPTPTSRATPTHKSPPTPRPTLTPDPTEIVLEITEQAFDDLKSIFPGLCDSYPWAILKSPDENWLAQDCVYESIQVIKRDGSVIWKVTYKEIFGKSEYFPYNQGGIQPRYWTNNSQYLYFSAEYCCWDPGIFMLSETDTLYRMNMSDGTYNLLRAGVFNFSFSPTGRRVTFIDELQSPLIVEIQDLVTGSVDKVKLGVDDKHNQASVDVWSSDGLKFVVSSVSGMNYSHEVFSLDKFSLIIIDVNDLSQRFIIKDMETNLLRVLEWNENDVLTIQTGYEFFSEPVRFWRYDLKTDTLTPLTPTP